MFFAIITLITALSIAGIAAWFSIVGLMSIFSAQALSTAIMAGALEVGKLVSASWLYRNWRTAGWFIKTYLIVAVLVLMLITSMGIFGFLSKAHLQNTGIASEAALEIERIDSRISREQARVRDAERVIAQLDKSVQVLLDNDRIRGPEGAIAVRNGQSVEREALNTQIDQASTRVAQLQDQRLVLSQKTLAVEQELGPLKYVAELIYAEQSKENLDRAVRMFILLLVSVFDPLAVILLIAANRSLSQLGIKLETSEPVNDEKIKPTTTMQFSHEPDQIKVNKTDPEVTQEARSDITEEQIEPEVREMVEHLVREETPDLNQLQEVARHLANSRANTNKMTEDEIVEVLAASTKESTARKKLGFWAVRLPDKDN